MIQSLLDTDLYKLTMQKAILRYRQNVPVKYRFINRAPAGGFDESFKYHFEQALYQLSQLRLTTREADWLHNRLPWLGSDYIQYLSNYQFNVNELQYSISEGELNLTIVGPWESTILWEVPLMAIISQSYFTEKDKDKNRSRQAFDAIGKVSPTLSKFTHSEFGTRRRRSYEVQKAVVQRLKQNHSFFGTSNVYLAMQENVRPIGTMAHEWIMGISALEGLRHANRHALNIWQQVYGGRLGIALTDTYGSDVFFKDFDSNMARLYDGVRHDSGDPIVFAEKAIKRYNELDIDPKSKLIIFSDGLDAVTAEEIEKKLANRIKCSFGIGTYFTNNFIDSPALKIVIKLYECDGVPVVKLGDGVGKVSGDPDAVRVAKWTFNGLPLDN